MCVCVALFLLRVYFLQDVSHMLVAHVNDCVEDRSERRLTLSCVCVCVCVALLLFLCREVLCITSLIVEQETIIHGLHIHFKYCRKSSFMDLLEALANI